MLTEWKLYNFKSIKELTNFCLEPVTVLAGANSSGKTTLLQSILLAAQTLSSPVATRPLVLNGEAVKLGNWDDIPHYELQDKPVAFECSIDVPRETSDRYFGHDLWARRPGVLRQRMMEGVTKVMLSATFTRPRKRLHTASEPAVEKVTVAVQERGLRGTRQMASAESLLTVRRRLKARRKGDFTTLTAMLPSGIDYQALDYIVTQTGPELPIDYEEDLDYLEEELVSTTVIGATFRHFLPNRLIQRYDATARQLASTIRTLLAPWTNRVRRRRVTRDLATFMEKVMFAGSKQVSEELSCTIFAFCTKPWRAV